jgi:hypothetical protein
MRLRERIAVLCGLALATACAEPDQTAMQGRVQAIDKRLDAIDQRLAALGRDVPGDARLRGDLQALERRIGAAESKATQALETAKSTPPPAGAAAPGPAGRPRREGAQHPSPPDPLVRRAELGSLMTEYRRRLSDLKRQQGNASPQEQLAARREVRDWYIARRRAIISGQPLPD